MPSFPPPSPPVITGGYTYTPRLLGGVDLNDRVNVFFDRYEVNSTVFVQAEQLWNQAGQAAIVKVDKKLLIIACYGIWLDTVSRRWEDFVAQLEGLQDVYFHLGDGTQYSSVYCTDIIGTQAGILDSSAPPLRAFRWTLKLTSRFTVRVPV